MALCSQDILASEALRCEPSAKFNNDADRKCSNKKSNHCVIILRRVLTYVHVQNSKILWQALQSILLRCGKVSIMDNMLLWHGIQLGLLQTVLTWQHCPTELIHNYFKLLYIAVKAVLEDILLPLSGHRNLPWPGRFFFSHPYSFHFDASMGWRHSMAALTFPIRLAQCGSGLLISNNATATVVASVFSGLPLFPSLPAPLSPPVSSSSSPLLSPPSPVLSLSFSLFLLPHLAQMGCAVLQYDTRFGERQLNCCQQPHAALAISTSEE